MAKTKILPIVATTILAGAMFFAGCEKEAITWNLIQNQHWLMDIQEVL